ncbi:hypothetical protein MMC25_008005 [Agyrium rufum]|nr:hypothetical protein [Agyrium rufum]
MLTRSPTKRRRSKPKVDTTSKALERYEYVPSIDEQDIYVLLVGPKKRRFQTTAAYLKRSPVLDSMVGGPFLESSTKIIEMPEDDIHDVRHMLSLFEDGTLPLFAATRSKTLFDELCDASVEWSNTPSPTDRSCNGPVHGSSQTSVDLSFSSQSYQEPRSLQGTLIRLYVLAEKYIVKDLQQAIVDLWFKDDARQPIHTFVIAHALFNETLQREVLDPFRSYFKKWASSDLGRLDKDDLCRWPIMVRDGGEFAEKVLSYHIERCLDLDETRKKLVITAEGHDRNNLTQKAHIDDLRKSIDESNGRNRHLSRLNANLQQSNFDLSRRTVSLAKEIEELVKTNKSFLHDLELRKRLHKEGKEELAPTRVEKV